MYWDNNRIGQLQNGLMHRGYRVRRVEADGLITVKATAPKNDVEFKFRHVSRNQWERLA